MRKSNRILVKHGERDKLMSIYNCTYPTVRTALGTQPSTDLHYKIRHTAIERGGLEMRVYTSSFPGKKVA